MRLAPLLVDLAMNMNEEMNAGLFLSLLTPRSFLMLILSLSSSLELVVLLWVWVQLDESVKSGSTYVAARMVHRLFIYRSRSGAKTNTPVTYCTGPSTKHSTLVESEPTTTALCSNSWAAAGQQLPYTDIDSFFVTGPTSQPFAGWSEVSLVWNGKTELDKEKRVLDRNYGQQRP